MLWKSRRQDRVALSSCEAEFYSGASASKDTVYIDRLTKSLRPDFDLNSDMLTLYMDNKSAIQAALNAQDNEKNATSIYAVTTYVTRVHVKRSTYNSYRPL